MEPTRFFYAGCLLLLAVLIEIVQPTCVLESDFGFKINCAFKKSGLFRVRNLGGLKAHASIGFSLGDELGFEQSLTNQDPSRRRSVSVRNGAPTNVIGDATPRSVGKQEKRGKQNRIMMRPMAPVSRPNQAAMDKLSTLHRRVSSTMQPIVVPSVETPKTISRISNSGNQGITLAKPVPMGVPPFKPLPPKEDTLKVVPIAATKKIYTPMQIPQSKGPGLAYQNPVPKQVHDIANAYNTKKIDDYNTITGYGDDTTLKFNKEDINAKIAEIAKAGNISMEAVEAAIALRQQQLLNKYTNFEVPTSTTTTTTTTTTEKPIVFQTQPEPEIIVSSVVQKPKRHPTTGKVMNAPREYYPVGYEKNFDDHFQSKVDLPETNFHCGDQKYFPGLYGDESLGCMVFHVCALTDDGLVMKSFLCPESTLFDQTILKCNWWFYVDCKNTRRLYDTNIPVSKSYQLMKALTFFSSYKKEMQEDGRPTNPEEVEGIKEAISILENHDSRPVQDNGSNSIQIVTPQPIIVDERSNTKTEPSAPSPVYRSTRNFNVSTNSNNVNRSPSKSSNEEQNNSDYKFITVNAGINFNNTSENTSTEKKSSRYSSAENTSRSSSAERKHRRRMTLKNSTGPTTTTTTTVKPVESTTSSVEIIKQEIQPIEKFTITDVKQEKLTDQLEPNHKYDSFLVESHNLPPVKRFYRSSAESIKEEKEMTIINNEKVQIIRPTSMARLVGEFQTPTATIAKLDEAVLGKPRSKKSTISIVTPEIHRDRQNPTRDQT
ncbi:uncharacterized protein LOC106131484 isoform X2 [Amyelois transitella]|uniref:uncharacterized protein LOC106131484 isoform X2 n=1 Tax=Amyelois transitella TaxID=680683 RepID=UPI00298F8409|nr:uncharacterized protein LOC106131484 isoform X2 [Amyelois transitella]